MQRTLILLKPDTIEKKLVGSVIARFESADWRITGCKMIELSDEILAEHYAHIADKPFYPEVKDFMQSTPVIAMVLEGDDIVANMRDMLGVTNCLEAAPGTIRAEWGSKEEGKNMMCNIAHASDSPEAAEEEVKRFFESSELFAY